MTLIDNSNVLAQTLVLRPSGRVVPNRVLKSAMTELVCEWSEDPLEVHNRGKPTPEYLNIYAEWGKGNIGVLVLGNIVCDFRYPEGRGNPVIDKAADWDHVALFKPVIRAAKADGALVICQLSHAGRQTENTIATIPVSSSDVKSGALGPKNFNTPRPLRIEEIEDVVDRFAFASKVLYDAGADGIQLHAAHGYLLSQFLSPNVNTRNDKYGGSLENRSRIIFEMIKAIKERVGVSRFVISIKLNSADFTEGGFDKEDCKELALRLEAAGVDLIELSGGTYESLAKTGGFTHMKESTIKREAYFIEFSDQIRPHLKRATLAVTGGFRTSSGMARAIRERSCHLIGMARPLTAEPRLVGALLIKEKDGAKENKVPGPLQTASSGIQIVQMGRGEPLSNLEDDEVAKITVGKILGMSTAIITNATCEEASLGS